MKAVPIVLAGMLAASAAQADVYIALQETGVNGGARTTVASGADFTSWSGAYGPVFNIHNISVTDFGAKLASTSLDILGTAAATLRVFVTATNQVGLSPLLSSLTSNLIPAGGSVTLSTFVDAGNGVFATTTPLASHAFAAIGTDVSLGGTALAEPYSVTGLYELHSPGGGLDPFLDTIRVSANPVTVPEPSRVGMLGMLLAGAGILLGRRSAA